MTGFIWTDLLALRKSLMGLGFVTLFYLIWGIVNGNPAASTIYLVIFIMSTGINTFAYTEQNCWDCQANTFPVKRSDYVLAKYVVPAVLLSGMLLAFTVTTIVI